MGTVLTVLVLSTVLAAAVSYPVMKWISDHHVAIEEVGACLNETALKVNSTLAKRLPEKCQDLLCDDKCDSDDLDADSKEKCEECLCEAEYYLEKMDPPLEPQLLRCCKPLSKDKGTEFLVEPCEELVTNLTKELDKHTKECERKNIIKVQPMFLALVKLQSRLATFEYGPVLSSTPYLQGMAGSILLMFGFASVGIATKWMLFGSSRRSSVHTSLQEQLL